MLELKDIHTYYGESYILQGVSLEVRVGSTVALLGRNGMGKTTTIVSIIGLNPPRRGEIYYKGEKVNHLPSNRIARKGIGFVPQGRRIFPSLTVEENLTMAARKRNRDIWDLDKIYSLFPILKQRGKNKGNDLSGGEQQMLAIARTLMTNPELLLMDEPSEGLAPIIVDEIGSIINQLKNRGFSILLVEQHINMALNVSDYTYIIDKGKIVYQSTAEELSVKEDVKSQYLGVDVEQLDS